MKEEGKGAPFVKKLDLDRALTRSLFCSREDDRSLLQQVLRSPQEWRVFEELSKVFEAGCDSIERKDGGAV